MLKMVWLPKTIVEMVNGDSEKIFMVLIQTIFRGSKNIFMIILSGVFLTAILAAIMSTADSQLWLLHQHSERTFTDCFQRRNPAVIHWLE